jgi:hypothetical protein
MIPSYVGADPPEWNVARDAPSGEPRLKPRRLSYLTPQRSILALESNQSSWPAKLLFNVKDFVSPLAVSAERGCGGAGVPRQLPSALAEPAPKSGSH